MPRAKKPAGRAADPRNGQRAQLEPITGGRVELPKDLAAGLLEESRAAWDAYWADPVSQLRTAGDLALLLRWIENTDRLRRVYRAADSSPLLATSQGQSANPLYAVALKLEAEVRKDEAQLGIGPLHRSRLGLAVVSERKSLAELNDAYRDGARRDAEDEDDPRVVPGDVLDGDGGDR